MSYWRGTNTLRTLLSGSIILLLLIFSACSDNPTNNDSEGDDQTDSITEVEGEIGDYELGAHDLYEKEDFVDLIDGSINEEGTFSVQFLEEEEIEEALKSLNDDREGFVGMYCREEIMDQLDSNHLFVDVNLFNFTFGEDNNVGGIGLSSNSTNRNVYPPQSDTDGDYQIRWIYSSQEVAISENCETAEVNVEFNSGWNEVLFDVSDRDNKKMLTDERPSEIDWVLDT